VGAHELEQGVPGAAGRSIHVDGATLYCEERGAGTPVVLIHAGLVSSAMWEPLLLELGDDFRVITPDSRGHGRSTNESGALSYPQIADDLAALIAELGLIRPVVGGYSDGGQVALELGARHPDAAGALIVGAAYPDFSSSGLFEVWRAFLGADGSGTPDLAHIDTVLGQGADHVKSMHPGGDSQWRALIEQTAPMWL
jgi:pimeloyl-ACP methyl ester carboxylesterase